LPHSQSTTIEKDTQVLGGIAKDLQTVSALYLGGTTYTPGSLAALIQSRIDAADAVNTTRASWLAAVKTYQAIHAEVTPVVRDLRSWAMAAFGPSGTQLADFGFAPAARPIATPKKASTSKSHPSRKRHAHSERNCR
jgi:hypothetical protein